MDFLCNYFCVFVLFLPCLIYQALSLSRYLNNLIVVTFAIFISIIILIVDTLNEFYGLRLARIAILISTVINALLLITLNYAASVPVIDEWKTLNESYMKQLLLR